MNPYLPWASCVNILTDYKILIFLSLILSAERSDEKKVA